MVVRPFFHPATSTWVYVVADEATRSAAIIDPALDFDARSGRSKTAAADELIAWIRSQELTVEWILETHAHADHLTAAPYLDGLDSLLAIVQMPPGIPVATVAINGARNAGILAAQIIATGNPELAKKMLLFKEELKDKIIKANEDLSQIKYDFKVG